MCPEISHNHYVLKVSKEINAGKKWKEKAEKLIQCEHDSTHESTHGCCLRDKKRTQSETRAPFLQARKTREQLLP